MMAGNGRRRGVGALALLGALAALVGCGGGSESGSGDVEAAARAQGDLSYGVNPAEYVRGQAIRTNPLHQAGGAPLTSFSVSPALPAGLALSPTTGAITGTPTVVASQATYTVTASGASGSSSVRLALSVRAPKGHLLSGRVNGVQRSLAVLRIYSTSDGRMIAQTMPNWRGEWSMEGLASGTYRVDASVEARAASGYKVFPSSRTVTVGSGDAVAPDVCIAETADRATICRISLSSSSARNDGACVPFTADIISWHSTTMTDLTLRYGLGAGGLLGSAPLTGCGASGDLAPGECTSASGSLCVPKGWPAGPEVLSISLRAGNGDPLSATRVDIDVTP